MLHARDHLSFINKNEKNTKHLNWTYILIFMFNVHQANIIVFHYVIIVIIIF